jgi:IS4 transposase
MLKGFTPALTIAQIYKQRWRAEFFFKWIKQHLRIKAFYGTSENAVKDANLDCGIGVCAGGDRAQAVGSGGHLVPDSTDSQRDAFRESAHFIRPSARQPGLQFHLKRQPTDSFRLLTGQR